MRRLASYDSLGPGNKGVRRYSRYCRPDIQTLVTFNRLPALTYENTASSTSFEVFYTLSLKNKVPVIDCVYGNIRNAQNGASIRKAVCNLNQPLSSKYKDLVFAYSDK